VSELIQFQPPTGTPALFKADLVASDITNWFAVSTRSQHERIVVGQLERQGVAAFLPTVTEIHRWSDRRKIVELPLFRGYLFVRGGLTPAFRRTVLLARGVVSFITMQGEPVPIPDEQIDSIQRLLLHKIACQAHPFLKVGQRVRVRGGALDGMEGILTCCNKDQSLVISIDAIQRSLAVRIEGYDVEAA
jgi:transcription antitermination factor NusG